ncbi:hypothetical protein PtA15_15A24 [Puccinia triticina]|uniref:Uncharacterized protein n=1 Tax=Puccinia triticina TaxID=208348 RepID=A0ABY7D427_9BASI|nr:uncharacterized protein PtA15_15A24 [Puccinia triticina]WAQ91635.1 hypothetical protein PtA15_15A24 [Puccinia triticina]WAR62434.1 hypothetical protein PtB15_15B18 [Puccinia triticina]
MEAVACWVVTWRQQAVETPVHRDNLATQTPKEGCLKTSEPGYNLVLGFGWQGYPYGLTISKRPVVYEQSTNLNQSLLPRPFEVNKPPSSLDPTVRLQNLSLPSHILHSFFIVPNSGSSAKLPKYEKQ